MDICPSCRTVEQCRTTTASVILVATVAAACGSGVGDAGKDILDHGEDIAADSIEVPITFDHLPDSVPDMTENPTGDLTEPHDASQQPDDAAVPQPSPTIADFEAILSASDKKGLAAFLASYDMPVCESGTCLFVTVRKDVTEVELLGDFNGWAGGLLMTTVPFSPEVHYSKVQASFDAWMEYKLKLDGQWALDESNRYFRFGPFGPNSAVYGHGHSRLTWFTGVASVELSNTRSLYIYLPAEYFGDPAARFPVLYLQDGFNVFTNPAAQFGSWDVDVTADKLSVQGLTAPAIMVGVDTGDRLNEYLHVSITLDDGTKTTPKLAAYAKFLTSTVKPLVDAKFRTLPDRDHTGIAGSSLGGISALWIAWHHASVFSRVASFSGSFWVGEGGAAPSGSAMRTIVAKNVAGVKPGSLRVYLDAGDTDFDGTVSYDADSWVHTDWTRNALVAAGWANRPEWDTDVDLATPPADLPPDTPIQQVPALAWSPSPPPPFKGWSDYLGLDHDLLCLVGDGHMHNEEAWKQRFGAALMFLFPG